MIDAGFRTQRRKVGAPSGSLQDLVVEMSEGNPGAITVMMQLINRDQMGGFMRILDLDDMNIRGSQVWIGYKDHCGQDIEKFEAAVSARDPAMVETINRNSGPGEQAVTSGASYQHGGSR